ncbi:MAG TPA: D-alanine--D-alanine ligase [Edaphocola sp.]|nr:D-alanine--D-alanine ligase [Edaphocola sp.]
MRKKIALVAGGYSGESVISLASAKTIRQNLDADLYETYLIIVERQSWWHESAGNGRVEIDKNDFSLTLGGEKITFDLAFIAIHGSPGEDGKLQGYFDLIGMPYSTCSTLISAVTFNKALCNNALRSCHVTNIAHSVLLHKKRSFSLGSILETLTFPVFVKPNESGSSLGVSKISQPANILPAIDKAFAESDQILIEEFIEGTELTIGVYRSKGAVHTLPATELVSKNEFFDYEAKYTKGVTDEITPARISPDIKDLLERTAKSIYEALHCEGMVRIDFILQKDSHKLYFLEVNTVPGQSENSLIPQQIAAAGLSLKEFYGNLIEELLS